MYRVILIHGVREEDLPKIPTNISDDILLKIRTMLTIEPEKVGKPLTKQLSSARELKTGKYRIIYRVERARVIVIVVAVGLRKDDIVFDMAGKRIQRLNTRD